jgi:hypothetical protein
MYMNCAVEINIITQVAAATTDPAGCGGWGNFHDIIIIIIIIIIIKR